MDILWLPLASCFRPKPLGPMSVPLSVVSPVIPYSYFVLILGFCLLLHFNLPYALDAVAATSTIHCVFSLRSVRLPVWDINHTLLLLSTASLISLFLRTKCYWYLWLFYIYSPSYRCMHLPIFILSSIHPCSAYWFGPLSPVYGISDILGRSMMATFQLTTWILPRPLCPITDNTVSFGILSSD